MSQVGKIKLRNIGELTTESRNIFVSQEISQPTNSANDCVPSPNFDNEPETSTATPKKRAKCKPAATASRKNSLEGVEDAKKAIETTIFGGVNATTRKSSKKITTLPGQQSIDKYFKCGVKNYKIDPEPPRTNMMLTPNEKSKGKKPVTRTSRGRKRLFKERAAGSASSTTTATSISMSVEMTPPRSRGNARTRKRPTTAIKVNGTGRKQELLPADVIVIPSSDDEDAFQPRNEVKQVAQSRRKQHEKKMPKLVTKCEKIRSTQGTEMACASKNVSNSPHDPSAASSVEKRSTTCVAPIASDIEQHSASFIQPTISDVEKCSISSYVAPTVSDFGKHRRRKTSNTTVKPTESPSDVAPMVSIPIRSDRATSKDIQPFSPSVDETILTVSLLTPPHSSAGAVKRKLAVTSTAVVHDAIPTEAPKTSTGNGRAARKRRPCPAYKVVAGTTFAVDAFQYGQITGVTHYFLTHYHADHYVGLTRKFSMPLYLSPITARLVRAFIPVENKYINEIDLNRMEKIAGIEVTAIDANHCPGAVMFVFKLPSGKCILHTGDFRASPEMESEPIFWNNWIDTIYLDTTYISNKYNFCPQHESIDRAKHIVEEFLAKRAPARILLVCGAYVIGKERFWCELAHKFNCKVWTEKNRDVAIRAMDLVDMRNRLCDSPYQAQLHVISMMKLSYPALVEYFKPYEQHFDALLAIRPSGWEKNSRPQLRGRINIVGIEYSEHSSHSEMERFVTYLKPSEVISTVPVAHNPMITANVPIKWYQYGTLSGKKRNFQSSITSYIKMRPPYGSSKRKTMPCVSPTKSHKGNRFSQNNSLLSMQPMETYFMEEEAYTEQLSCVTSPKRGVDIAQSSSAILPSKLITLEASEELVEQTESESVEIIEKPAEHTAGPASVLDGAPSTGYDMNADAVDDWMF